MCVYTFNLKNNRINMGYLFYRREKIRFLLRNSCVDTFGENEKTGVIVCIIKKASEKIGT